MIPEKARPSTGELAWEATKALAPVAFLYLVSWWSFSHNQKEEVRERQDYTCADCGVRNPRSFEVHHVVPQCKGGKDTLDNAIGLCGPKANDCHEKWDKKALEEGILWDGTEISVNQWKKKQVKHIKSKRRRRR